MAGKLLRTTAGYPLVQYRKMCRSLELRDWIPNFPFQPRVSPG